MRRILIIGNPGSGKSTFAVKLAEKTGLPLVHLDRIYWRGDWEHLSREEFDVALQAQLEQPAWIMDGNFNRTIPHRLQYCDAVFYFDLPTVTCLWGITQRVFSNYGKVRADMGGNCKERFDARKLQLYRSVLCFRRQHRREYYELLNKTPDAEVVVFKSRRRAETYLKQITAS